MTKKKTEKTKKEKTPKPKKGLKVGQIMKEVGDFIRMGYSNSSAIIEGVQGQNPDALWDAEHLGKLTKAAEDGIYEIGKMTAATEGTGLLEKDTEAEAPAKKEKLPKPMTATQIIGAVAAFVKLGYTNPTSIIEGVRDEKPDALWDDETLKKLAAAANNVMDEFNKRQAAAEETDLRRKDIIEMLGTEEPTKQILDMGEHGGAWYYGFTLYGREAIVTSNRKVYLNDLRETDGRLVGVNEIAMLFPYDGYIGDIAPTISHDTVKRFLLTKEPLVKPGELYKAIRDNFIYFMDFGEQKNIADVLACWNMATYVYQLFYWFPHILFNAPRESGKTKCGAIAQMMSFRGFSLGAAAGVTPAQIYRTVEGNRGTCLIDEFELGSRSNERSESEKLVCQILNAGASRDSYIIRNERSKSETQNWVAKKFPIFFPKIIANISGINPTTLSRVIAFKWLKTSSEKGKRKPERKNEITKFPPVQQDGYLFGLENWKEIKAIYDDLDIPKLKNRQEDNWLPLFAVARFIDKCDPGLKVEEKLLEYLDNYAGLEIETSDETEDFFNILLEKVSEPPAYYTPKDIGNWFEVAELIPWVKAPANWVGKRLTLYKFPTNRSGGGRKYMLSKSSVKAIIDLYFNREVASGTPPDGGDEPPRGGQNDVKSDKNSENVPLCAVSVVPPEGVGDKNNFLKNDGLTSTLAPCPITTHNNTNNTEQHKQHITAQHSEDVSLCGVSAVTPDRFEPKNKNEKKSLKNEEKGATDTKQQNEKEKPLADGDFEW